MEFPHALGRAEPAAISGANHAGPFSVAVLVEPEPGRPGDRSVLERLAAGGLSMAAMTGSAKVVVTVPKVEAKSESDAMDAALSIVRGMLPREGYVVSDPEVLDGEKRTPAAAAPSLSY